MVSEGHESSDERTILTGSDPEFLLDLSEYLDVLASPVRLHILSYLGTKPRTVRQIAHEIETSYENTKKHLTKLQSLGLIRKEIGVSHDPSNQGQPVFYFSLVPGGLDHAVQSLAAFSSVAGRTVPGISERVATARSGLEDIMPGPTRLTITNGQERGMIFALTDDLYRIGRIEDGWDGKRPEPALLIPDSYRSVTRVSRPHAWIRKRYDSWMISEGESRGGTTVNGNPVYHDPVLLKDGDLVELSPGPLGAGLLFQSGKSKPSDSP